jgi:hypothetical protein
MQLAYLVFKTLPFWYREGEKTGMKEYGKMSRKKETKQKGMKEKKDK